MKKGRCVVVCNNCGANVWHKKKHKSKTTTVMRVNKEYIDPDSFGGQSSYGRD